MCSVPQAHRVKTPPKHCSISTQFYYSLPPTFSHHSGHSHCKKLIECPNSGLHSTGKSRALFCLLIWHTGLFPMTDTMQISYEQAPLLLRRDYSWGCKSMLLLRLFSVYKDKFSYRMQPGMDREQENSQNLLPQTWSHESWNRRSHLQQPPIKFYMSEPRRIAWSRGQQACWYPVRNKPEESSHFVKILQALQKIP